MKIAIPIVTAMYNRNKISWLDKRKKKQIKNNSYSKRFFRKVSAEFILMVTMNLNEAKSMNCQTGPSMALIIARN